MQNNPLNLETPIGILQFYIQMAEGCIQNLHLSKYDIKPVIPAHMNVQGCVAILLKCSSITPLVDMTFSCAWQNFKEKGYGNSGEGLEAWEWKSNKTLVMIGTEDDMYFGSRINLKKTTNDYYSTTMENNIVKIHISKFPANKELTLHYVVSWNPLPEKADCSCWFAVDIPHERILRECQ